MSYTIIKTPLKGDTIIGQELAYTVLSTNANSGSLYKYKYICYVYTGSTGTASDLVATLKASPNTDGYGIFTIDGVVEQYVKSDNIGYNDGTIKSEFKGTDYSATTPHPIHLIDKFSLNRNSLRNFLVIFAEEYATTPTGAVSIYVGATPTYVSKGFNGVDYGLEQLQSGGNYGVDLTNWNGNNFIDTSGSNDINFLTDAPYTQYIGLDDYHTMAFLAGAWGSPGTQNPIDVINLTCIFYDSNDSVISSYGVALNTANGGWDGSGATGNNSANKELQFFGCGPANRRGYSSIPSNTAYYTIYGLSTSTRTTEMRKFIIKGADCKGFEQVRLTWLNKYGTWDYYNFTKKNLKSTDIKRDEYNGVKGNWNSGVYSKHGYNRGRSVLNTNATKIISCNSDWFTTDEEAAWLEQLFISNEVYILSGFDTNDAGTNGAEFGKYVIPCIVTSNKYEKYTRANDKVAQYQIEVEYASNMRIQKG
jgi:hypothetical protein